MDPSVTRLAFVAAKVSRRTIVVITDRTRMRPLRPMLRRLIRRMS